ncbi:AbrB/MazE/SpoVT family DNA-binding domain-containing protein [Methanoculleus sp. MH98A]|uniref:AbrB/MazE/SpoVT family DNA-binding domain-containing protein n=1 Tax=Methanoculleus sp. MH98A TaxID=1495314 RepID=UPI001E3DF83B|nr:AbrB/MazE/SpoVT family DNA-binding domain-containing protein [Methanoculleus sp. MH98A]
MIRTMFNNHHRHHDHGGRRHIFGTVKVGERGQIVIPKEAREIFDIKPGDTLMILGDEGRGLAVVKADKFRRIAEEMLRMFEVEPEEPPEE